MLKLLFIPFIMGIICFISGIISKYKTSKNIDILLTKNNKHIRFLKYDKVSVKQYILQNIESYPVKDIEKEFWINLYEYYLEQELQKLKNRKLTYPYLYYQYYFMKENNFQNFKMLNILDTNSIIFEAEKAKIHEEG